MTESHMSDTDKLHVVFAGNPGVGKSFILNALVGAVKFESGLSFGEGLTKALQTHEPDDGSNTIYSDTPGLDDLHIRQKAAEEISNGLHKSRRLKLIFVVTLEDGRVRPSDLTTIGVILQAIEDTGVPTVNGYSVIVNKCNAGELRLLESERNRDKVRASFSTVQPLEHIGFFPRLDNAAGVDNVLLQDAGSYRRFAASAPVLEIPNPQDVTVDISRFDRIKADLERELDALRRKLALIEKERDNNKYNSLFQAAMHTVISLLAGRAIGGVASYMRRA